MFTSEEIRQIEAHGLTVAQVERQIENFRTGFPSLPVVRAASGGDGVRQFNDDEIAERQRLYEEATVRTIKFVPASGAATRMFKELFEYVNDDKRTAGIDKLITNLEKFAFFPELAKYLKPQIDDKDVVRNIIVDGLGYGSKPKGLVTFHAYSDGNRKAVEEHLAEGAMYAASMASLMFSNTP